MAGELASAIAKTGQPRNRPQSVGVSEAALENAFNGRRRADEAKAAKEAADRDKRLEEISKNTIFSKQFENDIYNRQFQEISKSKLDNIYKTYLGGGNLAVEGTRAVQELQEIGARLHTADKNLSITEAQFNKDPSSVSWFTQADKDGRNVFQAIRDPKMDGRIQELNDNFSNPAIIFQEDDINGTKIYTANTNLGAAATMDGITEANKMITDKDYNRALPPTPFQLGNTQMERYAFGLQPETVKKVVLAAGSNPAVSGYAIKNKFFADRAEALKNGKALTYEEWANASDIPSIPLKYLDNLTGELNERTGNDFNITDRLQAPREPKATPTQKNYNGWSPEPTYDRNTEETLMSLGQGGANPRVTDFLIPVGTKSLNETGKLVKSDSAGSPIAKKAIAKGVATLWNDSEKGKRKKELYMKYLIDTGDGYEAQYVPATNANFREFAQITESTETEEDMQALLDATSRVVGTGGKEIMDGFTKELYGVGVTAKFPSGKPAATTTKMNAQGKPALMTESEFNAAWSKAKSGTILTGPDGKQYKKP